MTKRYWLFKDYTACVVAMGDEPAGFRPAALSVWATPEGKSFFSEDRTEAAALRNLQRVEDQFQQTRTGFSSVFAARAEHDAQNLSPL